MTGVTVEPLDATTWPDFARLVERHKGVWGGCWCMAFHLERGFRGRTVAQNRADKERLVRDGHAHAALVYDGPAVVGWCQFGPAGELPRIDNSHAYAQGRGVPPDWRITCFFVDRGRRKRGVASAALDGALHEIARLGGGVVESYPEDVTGRSVSSSFLHNGSLAMFERAGFTRSRRIGKNRWVVTRIV